MNELSELCGLERGQRAGEIERVSLDFFLTPIHGATVLRHSGLEPESRQDPPIQDHEQDDDRRDPQPIRHTDTSAEDLVPLTDSIAAALAESIPLALNAPL